MKTTELERIANQSGYSTDTVGRMVKDHPALVRELEKYLGSAQFDSYGEALLEDLTDEMARLEFAKATWEERKALDSYSPQSSQKPAESNNSKQAEKHRKKLERRKFEVELRNGETYFVYHYQAKNWVDARAQIIADGLTPATLQVILFIRDYQRNLTKGVNRHGRVIEDNRYKSLWLNWDLYGDTGVLFVPDEGFYLQDHPEIKEGELVMERSELVGRLNDEDSHVRFVSQERYEKIRGSIGRRADSFFGENIEEYTDGLGFEMTGLSEGETQYFQDKERVACKVPILNKTELRGISGIVPYRGDLGESSVDLVMPQPLKRKVLMYGVKRVV